MAVDGDVYDGVVLLLLTMQLRLQSNQGERCTTTPLHLVPRARTGVSPTLPWNALGCVGAWVWL